MLCEIDTGVEYQTIDGFGVSEAYHKAGGIYRLPHDTREHILDLLFDSRKGIGLSIVRNQIGDGGVNNIGWGSAANGSAESIKPRPNQGYVWSMPDWAAQKEKFDFLQRWFTREALRRGAKHVLATCWSPPFYMKSNGSVIGDDGAVLRPDYYQGFAEYLAEYAQGYKREFGIDVTHISPCNEPENTTAYPGCQWSPEQFVIFVRDFLAPVFQARNVQAKLTLTEYEHWRENDMVRILLNDDKACRAAGAIACHAYKTALDGLDTFDRVKAAGKPLWATESGEYALQGEAANGMEAAIYLARIIQKLHTEANAAAFLYWWGAADCAAEGSTLIKLRPDAAVFSISKRFYAMGHFSKFIKPGYKRVQADCENLSVSAYKSADGKKLAVVAVNPETASKRVELRLGGRRGDVCRFITDKNRNLAATSEELIPGESIVTLVCDGSF